MIKKKDLLILSRLRKNARETLTSMSKATGMPISTIYDKLKLHQGGIINKHTTILDFNQLGFSTRAHITLKVKREQKEELQIYLAKHPHINSLYKINNGFDFLAESVFKHINDLEQFLETLEDKFEIVEKSVYYIINDIKREDFISNAVSLDLVTGS